MLSVSELSEQIRELGVEPGDTLMVHASLRAIGPVDRGADGVIDALQAAVGPAGTLIMILGADLAWYSVSEPSLESASDLAKRFAPFDKDRTPAMREIGWLAEVFRRRPGVCVTDHPDGRFAAWGARADELLADTPWDHYYGPDSVLDRFCRMGGRILRLGANLDTVTALHLAEYRAALPDKRQRTIYFLVAGPAGPEIRQVTSLDNEFGIVDWRGEDYFALILKAYFAAGHGVHGRVGGAQTELIEAPHLVRFGTTWMEANLSTAPR
jgi:aminoglycoside 3-N-acetyltransferase